jgi:DnaJ-class molecular chaperone
MDFSNSNCVLLEAYQTLSLKPDASLSDARKSYFRLSLQYHPDKCKGGEKEKFQKISNAYQLICEHLEKKGKCVQHKQNILDLVTKYHDLADLGFLYTVPDEVLEEIPDSWIQNLNYFHDLFISNNEQPRHPFFSKISTIFSKISEKDQDICKTTDIDVSVSFEDAYIGDVKMIEVEVYDEDDVPTTMEVSILPCEGTYSFPEKGDFSSVENKRLTLCVHVTIRPHDYFYTFVKENYFDCECDLHLTLKDVVTGGNKYILMPDGRYVHICVKPNFLVRFLNGTRLITIPRYGFLNHLCSERGKLIVHFAIDLPHVSVDLSCLGSNLEEDQSHDRCCTYNV